MKPPADGWDRDERAALEALGDELEALRKRHADDPPLELLRAARAEVLPEPDQTNVSDHLKRSAWSRALLEGLDEGDVSLGSEDQASLLARIQKSARESTRQQAPRAWRWGLTLAAASFVAVVATAWIVTRSIGPGSRPVATPQVTLAVATPPPAFRLTLEKAEVKVSPAALAFRRAGGVNPLLADLKPALDAYRAGDYAAADREFATLAPRYPKAVEVFFYQGITRLFLNDAAGAIASLTAAEPLADSSFAWEIGWYRAIAEERAGNVLAARARLDTLCRQPDSRAPRACDALKRLPSGFEPPPR